NPLYFSTPNLNAALDAGDITWETIDTRLVQRYTPMFRLGQFEHNWDQLLPIDYEAHNATATSIAEQGVVLMKNENDLLPLDGDKLATMGDMLMIGPDSVVKEPKIGNNGPNSTITPRTQERPILALREALADQGYTAFLHENNGADLAAARELAAGMDAVIVVVTEFSSEFYDRDTLSLEPAENNDGSVTDQLALVEAMAEVNDNVIVLLKTANSVLTDSFEDDVEAMVQAWYPGQQDGLAVARVLTGEVNPGGKMPITWATQEREAQWAEERNWPGVWEDGQLTSYYTTGLEQGYRWYQANDVESSFPFGFGLSYTDFEMSAAQVTAASGVATVDVTVTNTGDRAGAEVPQVYLSFPDSFGEPPLRLVGFDKPFLQPGESATVSIPIDPQASNHPVGIFDVDGDQWVNPDGTIGIHLGTSSANTQQIGTLTMSAGVLTGVTSTGLGDGEDPEPTPDPDPQGHMVFYNDEWSNQATNSVHMPNTGEGDDFFSGDWDGDGTDTIAVRRG
ncbi:glycoside hydrolase family 3 C-terminal domain-containing protein, partial [Kocuria sp.]|uniref:glycoside hydrolase family 3 C-terminal domain-containing protein n=1 Tax=Kocuria sp. TaxID=1871328 RepID=UPI0026E02AAB